MKPDTKVFLPEKILGKKGSAVKDEVVNGEYGLVINGNSLVGGERQGWWWRWSYCS